MGVQNGPARGRGERYPAGPKRRLPHANQGKASTDGAEYPGCTARELGKLIPPIRWKPSGRDRSNLSGLCSLVPSVLIASGENRLRITYVVISHPMFSQTRSLYCLSYTAVLVNFLPFESVPVMVTVRVLPSADTTARPLIVTLSPFLLVITSVRASTFL